MHLSAGDMIPRDVRILDARDPVYQSGKALTGESEPVEKLNSKVLHRKKASRISSNIAFMGK